MNLPNPPEPGQTSTSRRQFVRDLAIAVGIMLAIAAMSLAPDLVHLIPRKSRRVAIDAFLRALLWGHAVAWLIAAVGLIAIAALTIRSPRRGRRLAKLGLLCGSSIVALGMAEVGSAVVSQRRHRAADATLPMHLEPGPAETLRLTVIGGSSARGYPYQPHLSIGQILGWKLGDAIPGRKVEVDILAGGGADLAMMHRGLAGLTIRPDILVIFSGHNEFQSRFAWSRSVLPLSWFGKLGAIFPLRRLIARAIDGNLLDAPPGSGPVRSAVDWPMVSEAERAEITVGFEHLLDSIGAFCRSNRILPIWIIPPSNDGGWAPSRSLLPESATDAERTEATHLLLRARREPAASMGIIRELIRRWPGLAEPHFRLSRQLEREGDFAGARKHDILARELDGLLIRCPEAFRGIYRKISARYGGILVDGTEVLAATDPRGILDYNLFHDGLHPTLRSHTALAEAALRGLRERGAFGLSKGAEAPRIDPGDVAAHFGMDAGKWGGLCHQVIDTHNWAASNTYDPEERLDWARRYGKAAREISRGIAPEATGIPGLGVSATPRLAR